MKTLDEFLLEINDEKKAFINPIIDYIKQEYPNALFNDHYGANTVMPGFTINDKYIYLACRKHYFTIHFSNYKSVKFIEKNYPFAKARVGCVNFSFKRDLPYILLYAAIDITLEN